MASVQLWLVELGCEQYTGILEGSGYNTVASLSSLDDSTLLSLGVLDSNHRRAILYKSGPGDSIDEDFDNMLGDLSSVIKDLEMFSVPTHIDASSLPTNSAQPNQRASFRLMETNRPPPQEEFDLDSLLSDLTSFNPTDVVAANAAPPTPTRPTLPSPHPSPARHPTGFAPSYEPHTSHQAHTVSPPLTPDRFGARAQSIVDDYRRGSNNENEVMLRSKSVSSSTREGSEEPTTVIVPQPDLVGTNKGYTHEAVQRRISEKALELRNDGTLTEDERETKLKEEKMRIGIEKMRLAHKKRVAIKVFNPDRSNKTVVVEEGMTAGMVCHLLVVKNHFDESPNWVMVEQLGDVSLERELEDHEGVVEVYSSWPREHNNVFLFKQNEKKYDLFEDPIKYFPDHLRSSQASVTKQSTLQRTEKARKILLQEYFSSTSRVPELEGFLHLKDGYKKSWKKVYCILRASGLYYSLKGKNKTAKHLVLMVHFDDYELFHGINFKKTLKAPSPYCFALRPLPRQFVPGPKDIKVLCSDEESVALSWTAGIRLAKYGLQLRDNFHKAKMTQFKLEDLAAGDGASPSAQNRASKLVGLRLEKHLDKLRSQYEVQKQEEEDKKNFFRSSPNASQRSENTDQTSNSQTELSITPPSGPSVEASPIHTHREMTPPAPVQPPFKEAPKPAPKPRRGVTENGPPPPAPPERRYPPQESAPYNPYPAPTGPPPPQVSQYPPPTGPPPPQVSPDPTSGDRLSPDKEALFSFAWYHGTIPRDEAMTRLNSLGGFDGAYLVRDSTTVSNSYVLTMFAKSVAKNFQILPMEHRSGMIMYRIDDGPPFASVDQLLRHYKTSSDRLPCRLTEYCPRPPTRTTEC